MTDYSPLCRHCGRTEAEHCEFEREMPDGCQCDPFAWMDDKPITPICGAYTARMTEVDCCANCEHRRECHGVPHG